MVSNTAVTGTTTKRGTAAEGACATPNMWGNMAGSQPGTSSRGWTARDGLARIQEGVTPGSSGLLNLKGA